MVLEKRMEITYLHKPFSKHCNKPVDLIPFGGLTLQIEFGHLFLIVIVKIDMETDVFA